MQLAGAVAIVTGAGSGIGAATTRSLTARGVTVVAAGDRAGDLEAVATATGATPVVCDVRDPGHATALVDETLRRHDRLDIVVANAGIGHAGDFATMPTARIADLLDVNTRAPMLLTRAALPAMLEQGRGAVVLVTSIAGTLLVPRETVYSASKAAVEAFAEPLREELRGTGVTVSTVLPAVVATGFFDARGEPYRRRFPRPQPVDRVAAAVVRAVEDGTRRVVVPPWFAVPLRIRGCAPRLYRALSRRFG
jgi:short-subunit dehydrogenase